MRATGPQLQNYYGSWRRLAASTAVSKSIDRQQTDA
jgi:hypothetical protein